MSVIINFCKLGIMSVCTEKDNGWKTQWKCFFSRRASWEKRCMHCVQGEFCDNWRAQDDAKPEAVVLKELQELLDADSKKQEEAKPAQDEYVKYLDKAQEAEGPKTVLPTLTKIFLNKTKGGP